jgi:hypothetical protein
MHGALEKKKKNFIPRKCSHLDSLVDKECKPEEKHYIHREVKCSHLVPEPGSR